MARSECDYLLELWDKNICPNCGEQIPEHCRIGSGKKADGGFCSLECYAKYLSGGVEQEGQERR